MLPDIIFAMIFRRSGPPNRSQINVFVHHVSKTSILRKSLRNTGCAHKIQGSDKNKTRKITKKSIQRRLRKKHRKKHPKNNLLHPFWPPKTSQNRSKIDPGRGKRGSGTKPVSQRHATCWESVEKQRESFFVKRP